MSELNLPIGYILGENREYQIIRREPLSEGVNNTFAEVYLVKKIKVRKKFALKVLRPEIIAKNSRTIKDFQSEIQFLMTLNHKNIISIDDFGTLTDRDGMPSFYLIMEFVDDGSIEKAKYSTKKKLNFFLQILDGLEYLHSKSILHRDIKPDNILIEHDTIVKIADFGIAKFIDIENPVSTIVGAPAYAPPEQFKQLGHLTPSSDLYAAGKTLYTMLSGSLVEVGQQITTLPANMLGKPWSSPILEFLNKSTFFDPRHRFQNVEEMRDALRKIIRTYFMKQQVGQRKEKAEKQKKTNSLKILPVSLIAASLIAVFITFSYIRSNATDEANINYQEALQNGIAMFHNSEVESTELFDYFQGLNKEYRLDSPGVVYFAHTAQIAGETALSEQLLEKLSGMKELDDTSKASLVAYYLQQRRSDLAHKLMKKAGSADKYNEQMETFLRLMYKR